MSGGTRFWHESAANDPVVYRRTMRGGYEWQSWCLAAFHGITKTGLASVRPLMQDGTFGRPRAVYSLRQPSMAEAERVLAALDREKGGAK